MSSDDVEFKDGSAISVSVLGNTRKALSFARFAHRYGKSYETVEDMNWICWFSEADSIDECYRDQVRSAKVASANDREEWQQVLM